MTVFIFIRRAGLRPCGTTKQQYRQVSKFSPLRRVRIGRVIFIGSSVALLVSVKKLVDFANAASSISLNQPIVALTEAAKFFGALAHDNLEKLTAQYNSKTDDYVKRWSLRDAKNYISSSFFNPDSAQVDKFSSLTKLSPQSSSHGVLAVDDSYRTQLRQQKEIERLEKENKELRKIILESSKNKKSTRNIKTNLVDMYSEILEELMEFDSGFDMEDHLPRVVVVGDQSAGKTSVLEMVVQARIFPRGSGEMMTRCPVMVTLSEGPYHIAQFKDSSREFDLTDQAQLKALRHEIELRMKSISEKSHQTIASDIISLNVKGPGLQRMVLVDLPGIINIETTGMAENTKKEIERLSRKFMSNRNAIILCVQDGSVDAERSLVTDLVSSVDPNGSRTVFVMTKVDVAEQREGDVTRIKNILEGKRFPMKARGYFAVVTGTGRKSDDDISNIKNYENEFFAKSQLLKSGIKQTQLSTHNLTVAVSDCFWQMVKASIEQEADSFKAKLFNLESQWRNKFSSHRELDRDGLFEKAKFDILEEILELSNKNAKHWDDKLYKHLFDALGKELFENVYFPVLKTTDEDFSTSVDIHLHRWAENTLPVKSVEVAKEVVLNELFTLWSKKSQNELFEPLRNMLRNELRTGVSWDPRAPDSLRHMQETTLQDKSVPDNAAWKEAASFMEKVLISEQKKTLEDIKASMGPGFVERWTKWKQLHPSQQTRQLISSEIDIILKMEPKHHSTLSSDEMTTIRKNIARRDKNSVVDNSFIREVWNARFKLHVIDQSIARCNDCKTFFFHYQKGFKEPGVSCDDVVLFWRMQKTLESTVQSLRQHILNSETKRLDDYIKDMLDQISTDREKKVQLITGKQVELAEQLKKVRSIYTKLENFAAAVRNEK